MGQPAFGIDFGTSNSTVGMKQAEGAALIALEGGNLNIPSAVFFDAEGGRAHFGRAAVQRYVEEHGGRFMRSMKSVLGSSLINDKTRIGARYVTFGEIIGLFIGHLKQAAEAQIGVEIKAAVIGRPVFFVDGDAEADRAAQAALEAAARAHRFSHVEFQFEPVAAALDYEQTCQSEELALVIDAGGGTSDFSLVRVSPEGAAKSSRDSDVLASHGVHIGGTDFDRALNLRAAMPTLGHGSLISSAFGLDQVRSAPAHHFAELATWHRINLQYAPKNLADVRALIRTAHEPRKIEKLLDVLEQRRGHEIAMAVEAAKIHLTDAEVSAIRMPLDRQPEFVPVSRDDLRQSIAGMIEQLQAALTETLRRAKVQGSEVQTVFLTGGSTALPLVRDSLTSLLPQAKVVAGDRFGSVGTGLAIDAARRFS
jgi:hypothetical chaperone protein